jgi:hypothetical protein
MNEPFRYSKTLALKKKSKLLQSAQVGGHGQIAAVESTPAGADAIRQ